MPSHMRFARLALVALALTPAVSAVSAQEKAYTYELGGLYSFVRFDGETALAHKVAPSLLFAYNFTSKHGVEAIGTLGTATPDSGASFNTQFGIFRLGYTYNFYPRERITSLFRMGVGRWAIDPERPERDDNDPNTPPPPPRPSALSGNEQHFLFYIGGGVRFHIKDWLAIRVAGTLDVINKNGGIGKSDTQATGDFGVVFFLGKKEPAPPPAPPAEPKPEEAKPEEKKPEGEPEKPPLG